MSNYKHSFRNISVHNTEMHMFTVDISNVYISTGNRNAEKSNNVLRVMINKAGY